MLSQLPPWTLPTISLVCRRWQHIAFPLLYQTLFFNQNDSTNQLVERIDSETINSPLCISACAHNLFLNLHSDATCSDTDDDESKKYPYIRLEDLCNIEQAILKLEKVRNVYWGSEWLIAQPKILSMLYEHVQSVELYIEICELTESKAQLVFGLKNLRQISLVISRNTGWDVEVDIDELDIPNLLVPMLRASPDLESLRLSFWNDESSEILTARWNPKAIFLSLATCHFACLRILRVLSDVWLFSACPEVQQFLQKHPQIHTIDLQWVDEGVPRTMSLLEIANATPLVRNFEGPVSLVKSLLNSDLSAQIESLVIHRTTSVDLLTDAAAHDLSHDVPALLPCLRQLCVRFDADGEDLMKLVKAAPMLEELGVVGEIGFYVSGSEYSEKYMRILELAPRLHTLDLREDEGEGGGIGPDIEPDTTDVKHVITRMASLCPRLEAIHHFKVGWFGTWEIRHVENKVVPRFVYRSGGSLFPNIDLPQTA
ncbi:hypothetical protein FS749_001217 [Ceratobasidium sp. UAMH 11750]|nr:hypothetical protein FS749_001217 [Ceratobasidium sp. UAMH 11750]